MKFIRNFITGLWIGIKVTSVITLFLGVIAAFAWAGGLAFGYHGGAGIAVIIVALILFIAIVYAATED